MDIVVDKVEEDAGDWVVESVENKDGEVAVEGEGETVGDLDCVGLRDSVAQLEPEREEKGVFVPDFVPGGLRVPLWLAAEVGEGHADGSTDIPVTPQAAGQVQGMGAPDP